VRLDRDAQFAVERIAGDDRVGALANAVHILVLERIGSAPGAPMSR
jgi:hypothetical protein